VPDLITAIEKYMEVHYDEPKPLVWTATAECRVAGGNLTPRLPRNRA
jgi:hypothetical protein